MDINFNNEQELNPSFRLIIEQKALSPKNYYVYDENGKRKYSIKRDGTKMRHSTPSVTLYGVDDNEIGYVEFSSSSLKKSMYRVRMNRIFLGYAIKTRKGFNSWIDLDFIGWHMEGTSPHSVFDSNGNKIITFSHNNDTLGLLDSYVITYSSRDYEVLGMLLFMISELCHKD